jgi:hypothetical protein
MDGLFLTSPLEGVALNLGSHTVSLAGA